MHYENGTGNHVQPSLYSGERQCFNFNFDHFTSTLNRPRNSSRWHGTKSCATLNIIDVCFYLVLWLPTYSNSNAYRFTFILTQLRGDRKLTEQMFAEGAIRVLCCTATLAWGVNLPVHSVIIRGTEVYNPEKGGIVDLSILDVQQIFGRAGRPQFDSSGEATLITTHDALQRYLDKLVRAVPIESNFIKQLADHLNGKFQQIGFTCIVC